MNQLVNILTQMSPYLLLGFLFAGIMHAFIPGRFYAKYLSDNSLKSVVNAALFGIPLPLCSCGVIPTAMSLRKEGASKGSVVSFLIATPQTGVDSILATYGLMGLPFAIIRPIAALFTAVFGGWSAKIADADKSAATSQQNVNPRNTSLCKRSFWGKCLEALKYGYVTMMQDIGKWLAVGLVVAALITIFVPDGWFTLFRGNTAASMVLVLCMAVPMYVCATGSIPIAVALMLKGLTPGAALVLLMAGHACNAASIIVVKKVLGSRTLAVYLLSIIAGSVLFGTLVDYLHFGGAIDFLSGISAVREECCGSPSVFSWVCTALLCGMLVNALVFSKHREDCHDNCKTENNNNMRIFKIEGMNCNHCRTSAENAILSVPGVVSASVSLERKEASVEGNASSEDICRAVESVGFECSPQ